ncbi:MAG TPA: RodZ domain-containing protein [Rhodanobacteraceae bacterium]|nr:RodZ domain-containing protein [Rhodanobacteraceae bacterium]
MTYPTHSGTVENSPAITDTPVSAEFAESTSDTDTLRVRLGQALRAAREARQLDIETCGRTLRLPVRILKKLEAGDHSGIDHAVYLRNYLSSYGACVGLPEAAIRDAINQLAPTEQKPELVSTGGVSRSHYLWQRYTTAATYAVLTAVIIVPLVWLGVKGGLDRELTHLEPLNSAPVAQHEVAVTKHATTDDNAPASTKPPHKTATTAQGNTDEKPLMASMAPFSALDSVDSPPQKIAPPAVSVPDGHTLSITLTKPSWVEVTTADNQRLEYSLLAAGTHKTWHSSQPLHVSIGDTTGASVRVDGKPVNLTAYQRANVAHFRIAMKDGQASVQAM